jgi:glycosyltransferase involved in cell wall biosynthesis
VISIVIPAKDAAGTIGSQLGALAGEPGIRSCEVIVADNGSVDGTATVAEGWADRLPVRVVDASARPGAAAARNIGAAASDGDLLLFVDADDVVLPGWLAAWQRLDPAAQLATGPVSSFRAGDAPQAIAADAVRAAPVLMGFLPYAYGGNLAIRRATWVTSGGFPEDWPVAEDVVLSWRLQLRGAALTYVHEAGLARRLRPSAGGVLRQHYRYGRTDPRLFREFRSAGARRPGSWPTAHTYLGLLARLPLLLGETQRMRFLHQLGRRSGRLVGSARERTWYP